MPLELLLVLVAGGITAIAAILHLTGRSARTVLTADSAKRAWLRHCPGDTVHHVLPATTGQAALITAHSGAGLVWAFGADTAARHLHGAAISERSSGLHIRFNDFSAPGLSVALSGAERVRWQALIAAGGEAA